MAEDPSSKQLLHDSAKSIIALASAVLAVSVSLLTGFEIASDAIGWFAGSWVLLLVSILLCILASGAVVKAINGEAAAMPGLWLNVAFYTFLGGVTLLSIGAFLTINQHDATTLDGARTAAVDAVAELAPNADHVEVTTMRVGEQELEIDLTDDDGGTYLVVLSTEGHELRSVEARP